MNRERRITVSVSQTLLVFVALPFLVEGQLLQGVVNEGLEEEEERNSEVRNDSNLANQEESIGTVVIVLYGFAVMTALLAVVSHRMRKRNIQEEEKVHEISVAEARGDIESEARATTANHEAHGRIPVSGEYNVSYKAKRQHCQATIYLRFDALPSGQGWKIRGEGQDSECAFLISDGCMALNGAAYWTEEKWNHKVVAQCEFNFVDNTFVGKWKSSKGTSGRYTSFWLQHPEEVPSNPSPSLNVFRQAFPNTTDTVKQVDPNNQRDDVPVTNPLEHAYPRFVTAVACKSSPSSEVGVTCTLASPHCQKVVVATLQRQGLFFGGSLRVGMTLLTINNEPIYSPDDADRVLRQAQSLVTVLALDGGNDDDDHHQRPTMSSRTSWKETMVTTSIEKTDENGIGLVLRKCGHTKDGPTTIATIRPTSKLMSTPIHAGMRLILLHNCSADSTSLGDLVRTVSRAKGWVTIAASRKQVAMASDVFQEMEC